MLCGDLAGVSRPACRGELELDAAEAFFERIAQTSSELGAGRNSGDYFALLLRRLDDLIPFHLPRGFRFRGAQIVWQSEYKPKESDNYKIESHDCLNFAVQRSRFKVQDGRGVAFEPLNIELLNCAVRYLKTSSAILADFAQ